MALARHYLEYLKHFGKTITLEELTNSSAPDLVGLRHDVDHDLDFALEMAFWEAEAGCRSTYFVLHTASYWEDPRLLEKCLQIQDFGHEVGLHLNLLSEWWSGSIDSIDRRLAEILDRFRRAGLRVSGVAAHGDSLCYRHQFINYWCFSELKPAHPEISETGLTAEGVRSGDERFRIAYPVSGSIRRSTGEELPLWQSSMREHGLRYHATHITTDHYFSDSGGGWRRSPDPLAADLSKGRFQVLMHPEYWQRKPKAYFFLSTARSGSKWLATMLENASATVARHEFSLNHRQQAGEWVAEKRTGPGFTGLLENRTLVRELLCDVKEWIAGMKMDYAESNVYLEAFLPDLERVMPDTVKIFITRDPVDIVTSIMARGWYQTPRDDRHRPIDVGGWSFMTPFERVCWYVRDTMEKLQQACPRIFQLEKIAADKFELGRMLKEIGIAFYPRLAERIFEERINRNKNAWKSYAQWSAREKSLFDNILGDLRKRLGYEPLPGAGTPRRNAGILERLFSITLRRWQVPLSRKAVESNACVLQSGLPAKPFSNKVKFELGETLLVHATGEQNAYLTLKGSQWDKRGFLSGWELPAGMYCSFAIKYSKRSGEPRIYALFFDKEGLLLDRRLCAFMRDPRGVIEFEFRPDTGTRYIDLALYMPKGDSATELFIEDLKLTAKAI